MKFLKNLATALHKQHGRQSYFIDDNTLVIDQRHELPQIIVIMQGNGEKLIKIPAQAIQLYLPPTATSADLVRSLVKFHFFNEYKRLKLTL